MYGVIGMSTSSLHRESTDSLIPVDASFDDDDTDFSFHTIAQQTHRVCTEEICCGKTALVDAVSDKCSNCRREERKCC